MLFIDSLLHQTHTVATSVPALNSPLTAAALNCDPKMCSQLCWDRSTPDMQEDLGQNNRDVSRNRVHFLGSLRSWGEPGGPLRERLYAWGPSRRHWNKLALDLAKQLNYKLKLLLGQRSPCTRKSLCPFPAGNITLSGSYNSKATSDLGLPTI